MTLTAPLLAVALFTFQNNFWVNLHQFLHADSNRIKAGARAGLDVSTLPDAEREAWRDALAAYASLASRDPVFDARLIAINDALGRAKDAVRLADGAVEPAVLAALNRAAPIYRAHLWPRHQQANDAWMREIEPRIDRHGAALTQALAKAYHTEWPAKRILVDVSIEAGQFGGYTTDSGPAGFAAHTTVSPIGEGSEGGMGVETIFHEASHAVDAAIMQMVRVECQRQQVRVPRNLWHAIIFYTTGELVRRELGMTGDSHYLPYAYRFDVYRKGMTVERAALEKHWQPWLDGKTTFEEALRGLVRDATR